MPAENIKKDLIVRIAKDAGITQTLAKEVLAGLASEIQKQLLSKGDISWPALFRLTLVERKARTSVDANGPVRRKMLLSESKKVRMKWYGDGTTKATVTYEKTPVTPE